MTIDIKTTELGEFVITQGDFGNTSISISPKAYKSFITLVRRGINTWDTAPVEIKQLADILLEVPAKT